MQASVASTSLKVYQVLEYSLSVLRNIASECMVADNQWLTLPLFCEISGAVHLALVDLTAGWLADWLAGWLAGRRNPDKFLKIAI